ncbi:isoprenoid synthase domain-containing protein [Tuber borchii]|uniref:Isoprenoid synthase domain-containing protein n=1 Tax=Tuber borchii TaxID=42251 RepID=A0A2T6ZHD4_TUBBO|nr:isoprenoid synthase domain-containing protein [Tuber borchii]
MASFLQRVLLPHGRSNGFTRYIQIPPLQRSSRYSSTSAATSPLEGLTLPPTPPTSSTLPLGSTPPPPRRRVKPEEIVAPELTHLKSQISLLCSTNLPGLDKTSKYYLEANGKLFRPMVVFLMSRATAIAPKQQNWQRASAELEKTFNSTVAPSEILRDTNPDLALLSSRLMPVDILGPAGVTAAGGVQVLGTQRRLAEIVELIHTATLLHDDVLDHAETRRGKPSANALSGNKLSILAGDYMLGRASVYLARLRNPEVIELLAEVIAELVKGELFQLQNTAAGASAAIDFTSKPSRETYLRDSLEYYLEKTYLKSASLISKSCRATTVLGGATEDVATKAYVYGRNLGLAFQLVDDVLDYTSSNEEIGKPAGADLELGLATAPVLYACEEFGELGELIERRFCLDGDAEKARELVHKSSGIDRTLALAESFCDTARQAISSFPSSEAKDGLEEVLEMVLTRKR